MHSQTKGSVASEETHAGTALVHARADRELAASHWLLTAASDVHTARREWEAHGIALLRCGTVFSALRLSAEIVRAASGTDDPKATNTYLAEALDGPAFVDRYSQRYYALVPASTSRQPRWDALLRPDAECLGRSSYLGVPHPRHTDPDAAPSYWCVPMDGPGVLCNPLTVADLVDLGRRRRAELEAAGDALGEHS